MGHGHRLRGPLRPFILDMLIKEGQGLGCKLINRGVGRPPWGHSHSVFILLRHESICLLGKGFSHKQGKDQGGISIDLQRGPR